MNINKWFRRFNGLLAAAMILFCLAATAAPEGAATVTPTDQAESAYRTVGLGMAAALAVSIAIVAASYAVARIGSAAVAALVEKPELLPRTILFIALGEGLAVLGFAFAMMVLQKI